MQVNNKAYLCQLMIFNLSWRFRSSSVQCMIQSVYCHCITPFVRMTQSLLNQRHTVGLVAMTTPKIPDVNHSGLDKDCVIKCRKVATLKWNKKTGNATSLTCCIWNGFTKYTITVGCMFSNRGNLKQYGMCKTNCGAWRQLCTHFVLEPINKNI